MRIPFEKYVSIGNDFVLVENEAVAELDLSRLSVVLCDRHFGIGSDGLLVYSDDGNEVTLRMFNPDGTEDFCGNGLRCAALHAERRGLRQSPLRIHHKKKVVLATRGKGQWIDVQLPRPNFDCEEVPARVEGEIWEREIEVAGERLVVSSVCTGTTHTVIFRDGPVPEELFQRVSPALERHEWYPERTSVIWAWPTGEKDVEIRIWERGVGETLGCGTGSAAVAACVFRKRPGLLALHVKNPGGDAVVAVGPEGSVLVSARAVHVYSGITRDELFDRYSLAKSPTGCSVVRS